MPTPWKSWMDSRPRYSPDKPGDDGGAVARDNAQTQTDHTQSSPSAPDRQSSTSDQPTAERPERAATHARQDGPFSSNSAKLRAHMTHDDTLARLQHVSDPHSEPESAPQPVDAPKRTGNEHPSELALHGAAEARRGESADESSQTVDNSADRTAGTPASPKGQVVDGGSEPQDLFAAYPPELRAHMRHDDTLARLQYLSSSLPESTPQAVDKPADEAGKGAEDAGVETPVVSAGDETSSTSAEPGRAIEAETAAEVPQGVDPADEPEPASSSEIAARVAEHDKHWDATEAGLPPGRLPESAESLASEVIESMEPDVRRVLEYQDAAEYIAENKDARPWLEPANDSSPEEADRADSAVTGDSNGSDGTPDTPKPVTLEIEVNGETLGARINRWDPARLKLPQPSPGDASNTDPDAEVEKVDQRHVDEANAVAYIATNKEQRPWLAPASDCEPAVQTIYASLDQGSGHAHVRHGPMGDDIMYANRVARLKDPAQPDRELRTQSVDGFQAPDLHYCAEFATRVHDVRAFAAVVAVLSEDPKVRQALESDWDDIQPGPVAIPIAEVLGPNGHEFCSGFRLKGDWPQSKLDRKQWARARAAGQDLSDLPEPQAERIPTFEEGRFVIMFKRNNSMRQYEINTIVAEPVKE